MRLQPPRGPRGLARLFPVLLALLCAGPALAQEGAGGWSLAADAVAGASLAADGLSPASSDSAALWLLSANFLHRYEGEGWGLVLSDSLDLSGLAAAALGSGGTTTLPAFPPLLTVYEAYARLELGDWGQLFVGKRRLGLGIGSVFAPGDLVDPRSGFWDQKTGFRGLDLAASLGRDISLRLALSLERNFEAWAAGMQAKAAILKGIPAAAADQPYLAALDGAAGPADPALLTYAASLEGQFDRLELAASGVYRYEAVARPALGLSYDLEGLIFQAEGAADFLGEGAASAETPDLYGTAGLHWNGSWDSDSLALALDYDYNGRTGLLHHAHYLLPSLSYTRAEVLNAYARALVGLEEPSALVSTGLTLYPRPGFDLEFTAAFCLGGSGTEFASLGALLPLPSPGAGKLSGQAGLAARVHF